MSDRSLNLLFRKELQLFFERKKQLLASSADVFRKAEREISFRTQSVVKEAHDRSLHGRSEVDEHVPAKDEIEFGEGGILGDILTREYARIADGADDLVAAIGAQEEALQALGRD